MNVFEELNEVFEFVKNSKEFIDGILKLKSNLKFIKKLCKIFT